MRPARSRCARAALVLSALLGAAGVAGWVAVAAAEAGRVRFGEVPRAPAPPKIDGQLDEAV
ncbi:MAG: hypothetical protein MUE47_09030, partial [Acidobacteria bacterium]|nr:hypothetical protein [Acidobacteriota bacterium]